jgi:hypothetical protein
MIKMKKPVKFSVGIIFFLVVSNIPPMQTIFKLLFDQKLYYYSTKDGSALFDENIFLGRVFHFRRSTTKSFNETYPEADTIIYRNFKPNPFAFWRYRDYIFDERYTLPYFPLEEARKKRQEWKEKMKAEGRPY